MLQPGDFGANARGEPLATVLGSCVSIVLYDEGLRAGGMNHFLLPGRVGPGDVFRDSAAFYGMYAVDLLVNELLRLGSSRARLKAKVFGGAAMLSLPGSGMSRIAEGNVAFAFDYLAKEGIPVLASDVGGFRARRIWLFPDTGRVLLQRIGTALNLPLARSEGRYRRSLAALDREGPSVIFDDPAGKAREALREDGGDAEP